MSINGLKITLFFALTSWCMYVKGQDRAITKIEKNKTESSAKTLKTKSVEKTQKSSVSGRVVYFVNDKVINNKRLELIPRDSIQSINIIKRDTIVHGEVFNTQIFVALIPKKED